MRSWRIESEGDHVTGPDFAGEKVVVERADVEKLLADEVVQLREMTEFARSTCSSVMEAKCKAMADRMEVALLDGSYTVSRYSWPAGQPHERNPDQLVFELTDLDVKRMLGIVGLVIGGDPVQALEHLKRVGDSYSMQIGGQHWIFVERTA